MTLRNVLLSGVFLALAACGGQSTSDDTAAIDTSTSSEKQAQSGSDTDTRTAGYSEMRNAYFGDMHIHTRNSFDAYIFNVRKTADDAYRFAKGETVQHPSGFDMNIAGGPLDFYTVTDHAEYLGILPAMNTEGHPLNKLERSKSMFSTDPEKITEAFQTVGASVRSGEKIDEIYDQSINNSIWLENKTAADAHYKPGEFTTFSAYEFTSVKTVSGGDGFGGANLHRNVFFKDAAPDRLFSTLDSDNPEDLWDWMDEQRAAGFEAIAIPHNSNVSNGEMFRLETYDGNPFDAAYADQRMRNEPLIEVTQVKGTSETHPDLSPNDEFADFGIYERLLGSYIVSQVNGSYAREALMNGLKLQEEKGFNPFQFGMTAASDSHVVGGSYTEKDYWSKVGVVDGSPILRGSVPYPGTDWDNQPDTPNAINSREWFSRWGASGLTGVWAEENTRESIFSAFRRKETFATTGPRMKVRMFAGYDYSADLLADPDLTEKAYAGGVPMGGDLVGFGDKTPGILAWAQRDTNEGLLQRLQVIKVTADGEQIYDVACAEGEPDSVTNRCPDNGASVDMATCTPTGEGASELKAHFVDPDFDAARHATYYVRVLENPACRWSTWEALRAGTPPRPGLPQTIQERAYTSPIWYIPSAE